MTLVVEIADAETRLQELLAKVEAGDDVILARAAPVVRMSKIGSRSEAERRDIARVVDEIMATRAGRAPTTVEEILAWRDEGRR